MLKSLVKRAVRQLGYVLVPIDAPANPLNPTALPAGEETEVARVEVPPQHQGDHDRDARGASIGRPSPSVRTVPAMPPVAAFLPSLPTIKVVDVGAMWAGDGIEPYSALRDAGLATVVGFEPVAEECEKLNRRFGPPHRYLQYAIGDGTLRRLHVCNESMTSSLYYPNTSLLAAFDGLEEVVRVVREVPIETHRLDDVPEAANADYLKIDVQGAELDVLRGAPRLLAEALVVHTEVEFVPLYREQPLFADVDQALRGAGYGLFALEEIQSRAYRPFRDADLPPSRRFRQALWTDAVYVRHLFDLDRLDADDLVRLFVILHVAYGATDLCTRVLERLDARTGNAAAGHYRAQALAALRPTDAA
jgi:FkbM family methyltransferase